MRPKRHSALRGLLTTGLTPRKKRRPPNGDVLAHGGPVSDELAVFLSVNETHPLDVQRWGELRPIFFEERFAFVGPTAAEEHLVRLPKLGWPVYFDAHFWNAFPIGATNGGDYWLAQTATAKGESTGVFLYDHETGELTQQASSIEELVQRERETGLREKRTHTAKKTKARNALLDPRALYQRAYWLTTLLRGETPDDLEAEMAKAPSFAAFAKEKPQLGKTPHLALYWLFAHAILENESALDETVAASASSKNAFVASARVLCKRLLDDPDWSVGALTKRWRDEVRELLGRIRPERLLDPERRKAMKASAARQRSRVRTETAGVDPIAMLDRAPLDLDVQLASLNALAKGESADFRAAVALLAQFAKKGGSPGGSKWPKHWRSLLADSRFRNALLILFRRGQEAHWTAPLHSDWFIEPLEKVGGPAVTDAFLDALVAPSHDRRRAKLALALHASNDPRAAKFFARLDSFWTAEKVRAADEEDVRTYARATIARLTEHGDRGALEQALARILRAAPPKRLRQEIADSAAELGLTGVADAIVDVLSPWLSELDPPHYASQDAFHHLGGALAALAPTLAAEHFEPVWKRYLGYGPWENARSSANLFAIGAGVLVPLLGLTKRQVYLPIAERYASWLDDHDLTSRRTPKEWLAGAHHLLHGARIAKHPLARALATRLVALRSRPDGAELDALFTEAARALEE